MVRILQVIHGYPMRYNAGSEVYTQGLAQALADRHEVHLSSRGKKTPSFPNMQYSEKRTHPTLGSLFT